MRFIDLFSKPHLIAAHRGDRSRFPENTLAALKGSIGRCDFVEMDIRLTKDKIPVILHDATLKRTSNVKAIEAFKNRAPWRVEDFTLHELKRLDFGSWFYETDPFGTLRSGEAELPPEDERFQKIPTLKEVLEFSKKHAIFLNLEIKDLHRCIRDEALLGIIFEMIRKSRTSSIVMLSSFRRSYLPLCREFDPNIATALLANRPLKNPLGILERLRADALHLSRETVRRSLVRKVRQHGRFVNVFVVNDPKERKRLFEWGVNGVFTDFL
ncbi:glycerophosphodiester phosphodiesterase [Hydrogenimonas urashimensis]|uniref:glycerophosphodiester phosphodiesterase n=1 Tax=Hydrogenimonas urashimensis TaxID=2740515 RepID=UPI0019157973|nr:glycerophosphodiester phosphodiesterase family protein [Hydrogenimonas urashimensis]